MPRRLTTAAESFPLAVPFRISRGVKTVAEVVRVSIQDGDAEGQGEGVPYPRYGQSVASSLAEIEAVRELIEADGSRDDLMHAMAPGAARNAIDCALWDLEARQAGSSVSALLGRELPARTPTAMTVSLDTPEAMAAAAGALASMPLIKIKVDRSRPAEQIRAVRAAAPRARLIVDPNESWGIEEVTSLQPVLIEADVSLLEQPLPADADAALEGFRSAVPIAADESVHLAEDLERLRGRYQVINIKLDKTGGLTSALTLASAARQLGFQLMVGCMVCSSLSIAPALVIAADCAFTDLDGPLLLREDRPGGVAQDGGFLLPPRRSLWALG